MKHSINLKSAGIASILVGAVALSSCGDENQTTESAVNILRFSAIPDENTTGQSERYAPVANWLSQELGVQVEFIASSGYSASVDKFSAGDVHAAWFGGVSGVQARDEVPNSQAIVSGAKDLAFKSYFIAHESTGLTKSEDFPEAIKGMKFTFGSAGSTSGCIMPAHFIVENTGQGPLDYFGKANVGFSGSHDKTAYQVHDGTFQAGAMNFSTYEKLVTSGKIDANKCRVIWETPTYADYNFTVRGDVDATFGEGFTAKLQKALIECKDAAVLKAFDRDQFVKVDNATFEGIAGVMKSVKLK